MSRFLSGTKYLIRLILMIPPACAAQITASAQTTILDDFDTISGWHTIVSEGAKLSLVSGPGKWGWGLEMDFDLSGVYGYVIAQKNFSLDLPANYEFTFDLRADAPVNNFEFKLFDEKENVYWIKQLNISYPRDWALRRLPSRIEVMY